MKYKGIWITVLVLFAIGIALCIAGSIMGAFDLIDNADSIRESIIELIDTFKTP